MVTIESVLEVKNVTKRFPGGIIASDHVNFSLFKGEIHALLGENGAGKTTLMNIIYGVQHPDEGEIYVHGKRVIIKSPKDAIRLGIGMVHQHFTLIPNHTVLENIALAVNGSSLFIKSNALHKKIMQLFNEYGLIVDLNRKVWQLSMGERQKVEIIKTLLKGASILIFDEPTSVLTPIETQGLFNFMRSFVKTGSSIIFITHKLDEALAVSHRITVIRKGKIAGTVSRGEANEQMLTSMMFGIDNSIAINNKEVSAVNMQSNRVPLMRVDELTVENDNGIDSVKNVTFHLFSGEILGIAGVAGNGQRELAEAIAGLRKLKHGNVEILGRPINSYKLKELRSLVGFIPEDPFLAVAPSLSIIENMVLTNLYNKAFSINDNKVLQLVQQAIMQFNIAARDASMRVKLMSGGNIQKVIVAREILRRPKILVAAYPTRGLDVSTSLKVRLMLKWLKNNGSGIVLISEDLNELLELSDHVAVISKGEIKEFVSPNDVTKIATLISN
ncbi:MAG: ABC transporter ATP-binding protein [Thermoprotei archaeon]